MAVPRRPATAALLLVTAATGCATFGGLEQHVSVDSVPRGVEVRDADAPDRVLGTTPFFVKRKRALNQAFLAPDATGKPARTEVGCRYRVGEALVANLAPTVIAGAAGWPIAAGVFVASSTVDVMTGAAFDCPVSVVLRSGVENRANQADPVASECGRLVVAPVRHDDSRVAELASKSVRAALGYERSCRQFVPPAEATAAFERFGVTHVSGLDVAAFPRERFNQIGLETGADHLVVPHVTERGRRLLVTTELFDLHSFRARPGPSFELELEHEPDAPAGRLRATLGKSVSLLPSAFLLGPSFRRFPFRVSDGLTFAATAPALDPAMIIGNLNLLTMDPPAAHSRWKGSVRVAPDVVLSIDSRQLTLTSDDGSVRRAELGLVHLLWLLTPAAVVDTPVGRFSAFAGVGPGLTAYGESGAPVRATLRLFAHTGAAYTTFVTDRIFVGVNARWVWSTEPHLAGAGYDLAQFSQVNATVGVYFPEAKSVVRAWF